jgi:hypothetical protein
MGCSSRRLFVRVVVTGPGFLEGRVGLQIDRHILLRATRWAC